MPSHRSGKRALANNGDRNSAPVKNEGPSLGKDKGLQSMAEYQPKNSTLIEEKTVEKYKI